MSPPASPVPPTVVPAETALLVAQAGPILLDLLDFVEGVQCWVKNQDGVYCWVNRAFLLNYSKETGVEAVLVALAVVVEAADAVRHQFLNLNFRFCNRHDPAVVLADVVAGHCKGFDGEGVTLPGGS